MNANIARIFLRWDLGLCWLFDTGVYIFNIQIHHDEVWPSPLHVIAGHGYFSPTGVGVTKAPFVNFSVSEIFDPAKVPARFFASYSFLTCVPAAERRQHLLNMNVIFDK